jgi:hypothetical protein
MAAEKMDMSLDDIIAGKIYIFLSKMSLLNFHNDKKYAEYGTVYVVDDISFHNFF